MKLIRSCIVSFSMYSKIPMPQFKWNDDDMKYMLVFFPWIGAVIGLLLMLWRYIYSHFGVADICYVCIGALIPIAVTGGFHIDGFMDTMDAFHSYKPREEKLAILKDSFNCLNDVHKRCILNSIEFCTHLEILKKNFQGCLSVQLSKFIVLKSNIHLCLRSFCVAHLSRRLDYNITTSHICQHLFSTFFDFFCQIYDKHS